MEPPAIHAATLVRCRGSTARVRESRKCNAIDCKPGDPTRLLVRRPVSSAPRDRFANQDKLHESAGLAGLSPSFRNSPQPFTAAPQDACRAVRPGASSHDRENFSLSRKRRKHTARLRRKQRIDPMFRRRLQTSILAPRTHRRILTYFANFELNAEKSGCASDQTKNHIKVSQNPHFCITRLRRPLPLPLTSPTVVLGFFEVAARHGFEP